MSLGIEDAAFVVGGGSSPFGLAVARELVDNGARVLLVDEELEALERAAEELGPQALPCVADLADPHDLRRVGGVAGALLGGVDGIVLGAAELPEGDLLGIGHDEWVGAVGRSLSAPLALLRATIPLLEGGGGAAAVVFVIPAAAGAVGAAFRTMLGVLLDDLAATLGPAIRVERVKPAVEHAGAAARLLAPR